MAVDQAALADRIRELPGLDADEKSALLGLLNNRKRYGLIWEDKLENVEEELREKLPVLKEVTGRRIFSHEPGAPAHILIEGDNLHALTALQYTHAGKIDVIYIDPPYNTGNRDFIYNDSFVDKEDSWRHSKWLSFMSKRLKLAKHLLKETGVIFISIDDNEQAQLKLLCDEIFREENFIANFVWKKKTGSGNQISKAFNEHEYIITYMKSNSSSIIWRVFNEEDGNFANPDNDSRGPWESCAITAPSKNRNINQLYAIEVYYDKKLSDAIFDSSNCLHICEYENNVVLLKNSLEEETDKFDFYSQSQNFARYVRRWAYVPDSMKKILDIKKVYLKKGNLPRYKKFQTEYEGKALKSLYYNEFSTQEGSDLVRNILGSVNFDYPKPLSLPMYFMKATSEDHSIVLDFFAGSGTTLHATMALNAEDGGSRQCILVTNNENNICEEVTYERNKRVIQGYTNSKGETVTGLTKNNLRYYRTDFVERSPSMKNRKELTLCAVDLLCIRENCYEPLKRFDDRDKDIRVFNGAESAMIIIFDPRKIEAAVEMIKQLPGRCKVYVFSPGHYAFDDEFEEVADKIELCALPEAILQAYNKVLPKAKRKLIAELKKGADEA